MLPDPLSKRLAIEACKRHGISLPDSQVVDHATRPLILSERRREIMQFMQIVNLVGQAFGLKLEADTDATGHMHVKDVRTPLPAGYDWSAYVDQEGLIHFTEYVLDDEIGATKQ